MIIVTGAAGFIGSCLVSRLNREGRGDILAVDDFSDPEKNRNLEGKALDRRIGRKEFPEWFAENPGGIEFVYHIGARTDTTETDRAVFDELNLNYSKDIWRICAENGIPLVYASSAATYGAGERGYDDAVPPEELNPLNPYGESKNEFDKWAIREEKKPPFWAGLKFFNVYGPNEYHKGRMASVVFHGFRQAKEGGKIKLFRSHNPEYEDGGQLRDFVYVMDVADICMFLLARSVPSAIYNVGTGRARAFSDLAKAVFAALDAKPQIEFIDMPEDLRGKYQYFTEAKMDKLRAAGYAQPFRSLEEGVRDYVQNYLIPGKYY